MTAIAVVTTVGSKKEARRLAHAQVDAMATGSRPASASI